MALFEHGKLRSTANGYMFWCPGCGWPHLLNTDKPNAWNAIWTWNNDTDRPTFSPSLNIVGQCHLFIRDGKIEYLSDCRHSLAGTTIDLPVWTDKQNEDFSDWD